MAQDFADKIFYGGEILTMDDNNPEVESLATKDDLITAIGSVEDVFKLAGASTEIVYLDGKVLLPGLIEPHTHAISAATFSNFINISGYYYRSYAEIKTRMQQEISNVNTSATPLRWCVFIGWDPELIAELPTLNAEVLDREFSDIVPLVVVGQNFHVAWANHKAFEIAGIDNSIKDRSEAVYGRKDGELTGELFEPQAIFGVLNHPLQSLTPEQASEAVRSQWTIYSSAGFTTVTDMAYTPNPIIDAAVVKESRNNTCSLRLAIYRLIGSKDQLGEKGPIAEPCGMLWEAGIKIISDGSPHCGTAAVREPYLDNDVTKTLSFPPAPSTGLLLYTTEDLHDMVRFYHDKGQQVAIHAHGERAIDQVIGVYEVLSERKTPAETRHRIEHLGMSTEDQIARAGKLDLALSFFVDHLYFYGTSYTHNIFGPERTHRWTPLSLATKHGLTWTIHQDHPAFPGQPRPFGNMRTAVTRTQRDDDKTVYGAEYRVSVHETLKAYTINAAWQLHRENEVGSLAVGKKADLLVITQSPYEVAAIALEDIKVIDTYIGGRSNKLTGMRGVSHGNNDVMVYSQEIY